jgi:hypothetical protein
MEEDQWVETGEGLQTCIFTMSMTFWVQQWRRRHATDDMMVVFYADDALVGFQHQQHARRLPADLQNRLPEFALETHPEKTRLIEFGRMAERDRTRGEGRLDTFDFLGLTDICYLRVQYGPQNLPTLATDSERLKAKLKDANECLGREVHLPIAKPGRWPGGMVRGYFACHAVPTNFKSLCDLRKYAVWHWLRAIRDGASAGARSGTYQ